MQQHPPKHSSQSLSLQQHQWRCNNIIPNTHLSRYPCNNTSDDATTPSQTLISVAIPATTPVTMQQHPPKHSSQSLSLQQHQWRCNNIIPNTHLSRYPCNNTSGDATISSQTLISVAIPATTPVAMQQYPPKHSSLTLSLQQHQWRCNNIIPNTHLSRYPCNNTSGDATISSQTLISVAIPATTPVAMQQYHPKHSSLSLSLQQHQWRCNNIIPNTHLSRYPCNNTSGDATISSQTLISVAIPATTPVAMQQYHPKHSSQSLSLQQHQWRCNNIIPNTHLSRYPCNNTSGNATTPSQTLISVAIPATTPVAMQQYHPKHSSQSLSLQQHQWRCNNIIPNTHLCRYPCNNTSGDATISSQTLISVAIPATTPVAMQQYPPKHSSQSLSLQQHQWRCNNIIPNTHLSRYPCNNTSGDATISSQTLISVAIPATTPVAMQQHPPKHSSQSLSLQQHQWRCNNIIPNTHLSRYPCNNTSDDATTPSQTLISVAIPATTPVAMQQYHPKHSSQSLSLQQHQ